MYSKRHAFISACLLCLTIVGYVSTSIAEPDLRAANHRLTLPTLFSDNMVVQSGKPVSIWGWAAPRKLVTIVAAGQKATSHAGADGLWRTTLKPISQTAAFTIVVSTGTERREIRNVVVGEVWLCSGQSNMEMPLIPTSWSGGVSNYQTEVQHANYPEIRLFQVPIAESVQPAKDVNATWRVCSPESVGNFSALAYFFGRELHQKLKRPVGLIQSAAGGTLIQQWMTPNSLNNISSFQQQLDRFEKGRLKYLEAFEAYETESARWLAAGGPASGLPAAIAPKQDLASLYPDRVAAARQKMQQYKTDKQQWESAGGQNSGRPTPSVPVQETILPAPARLFAAMIQPLSPFSFKGTIWYQGEGNTGDPYNFGHPRQYRQLFPALIQGWRQYWGQGDFPFYFCQLPNWTAREKPGQLSPSNPEARTTFPAGDAWPEHSWPELREAQTEALRLPHTGMAVLIDIGDAFDIHPPNKQAAALRLARLALRRDYGFKLKDEGPRLVEKLKIENGKAILTFNHDGGTLMARDGIAKGFSIAGSDRRFVPAQAIIRRQTVEVWSETVPAPEAVRYAWTANPQATLAGDSGLPVAPFRTDAWPLPEVHQIEPAQESP